MISAVCFKGCRSPKRHQSPPSTKSQLECRRSENARPTVRAATISSSDARRRGCRCWASCCGSRGPATMSRRMPRPVTPVMSVKTSGSCAFQLHQRLLHPLNAGAGTLDQRGAVPEVRAKGHDAVRGSEASAEDANDVQIAEPFAIRDVTPPFRHVFHVAGVHEEDGEPPDYNAMTSRVESPAGHDSPGSAPRSGPGSFRLHRTPPRHRSTTT